MLLGLAGAGASVIFYHWQGGSFTPEELDRLERYCDALPLSKGTMNALAQGEYDENIRVTEIGWIRQAPDIMWFYERLAGIFRAFNDQVYHYDLHGFSESPQFLVYRAEESGHFDWHLDVGRGQPRKLSLTLQLTDPARYEGGELQFNMGTETQTAMPKDRGVAIAFSSYLMHRVTPVTSGIRKAIVAWATGPDFK